MSFQFAFLFVAAALPPVFGQVTTYHYDNFRTGATTDCELTRWVAINNAAGPSIV